MTSRPGTQAFRLGVAVGLFGAFAYGVNVPFASMAQKLGVSAQQMSFYRSLIMALLMVAACLLLRQPLLPAKGQRAAVALAGLMSGCVALAYLASVKFNPVALSVVLLYTYPLIIILIEAVMTRTFPGPLRLGVFITAFIGIVIAVGPDLSGASVFGMGLALLAGFASAVLYVIAARFEANSVAPMLGIQTIVCVMSMVAILATSESFDPRIFALAPWPAFMSMLGYGAGFLAIVIAAPRTGSANLGLVFLIEPIVGIVSASLLLGQKPTMLQWSGVAIILAALAVDALANRARGVSKTAD
jgi:drug/metabolite transporter (DMT)-like permease